MSTQRKALIAPSVDDEMLVLLSEECGLESARDVLILRYREWASEEITWLAKQRGLGRDDVDELRQETRTVREFPALDCSPARRQPGQETLAMRVSL